MRNPLPITVQLIGTHGYTETVLVDAPMRAADSIDADVDDEAHQATEQTEVESDSSVCRNRSVV